MSIIEVDETSVEIFKYFERKHYSQETETSVVTVLVEDRESLKLYLRLLLLNNFIFSSTFPSSLLSIQHY